MNHSRNMIDAFDLDAYLQRFSPMPTQPHEVTIDCPTCGKNKLVVNTSKRTWHCWVCEEYQTNFYGRRKPVSGAGGLLDLVQLLEDCTRDRAVSIVADQAGHLTVPLETVEVTLGLDADVVVEAAPAIAPPPGWRPIDDYNALPYLQKRGITPEDVQTFGIVWCDTGLYAGHLIFPIWEQGNLVYYQTRAMWDEDHNPAFRKSLNPLRQPQMAGPSEVLMNLDVARHYPRVALVEGPVDNVHVGPCACGTLGKKVSLTQALKLRRAGVRALDLMWDGPTPREPLGAWPEMMRAAALLSGMFDVRLVFIPAGDPGVYPRVENDGFRARAVPASAVSRLAMV